MKNEKPCGAPRFGTFFRFRRVDNYACPSYNEDAKNKNLQGGVEVPTGGTVREPKGTNRCNSDTDS